jgi:hypothetical protein
VADVLRNACDVAMTSLVAAEILLETSRPTATTMRLDAPETANMASRARRRPAVQPLRAVALRPRCPNRARAAR